MSRGQPVRFRHGNDVIDVFLPFDLDAVQAEFSELSRTMIRAKPPESFSRDEWAYLCVFVRDLADGKQWAATFGQRAASDQSVPTRLAIPKEQISLWLPNNVSLLGPLSVLLCLATGAKLQAKVGSSAENLTGALRDFILRADVAQSLNATWSDRLEVAQFDRNDPRNALWSGAADVRIFFGGDAAASAVEALPHKPGSTFLAFTDHSSQIWATASALDDAALESVLRVFHVYGKAGCTSPQRLTLIGADRQQAAAVARRLCALADRLLTARPQEHIVSDTLMAQQVARARGWDVARSANGSIVVPSGEASAEDVPGHMTLCIVPASLDDACAQLPANIQTIGHATDDASLRQWLGALSASKVLRIVPVRRMHHFGPFWDGQHVWRSLFREVEVGT